MTRKKTVPLAVATSLVFLAPMAASSAADTPSASTAISVTTVAEEADVSMGFTHDVVALGEELEFGVGGRGPDGEIGQFSADSWTLPEGVTAEYAPVPEPVFPNDAHRIIVGENAPLGTHTISVTGTLSTGRGDTYPASATGSITIVRPLPPGDQGPHGYTMRISDSPIVVEQRKSATVGLVTMSPESKGTFISNFTSQAPEGLDVWLKPTAGAPVGTYELGVFAGYNIPKGQYSFDVGARLSDIDSFSSFVAAQELIVKVVEPGGDVEPVRPDCTVGDKFSSPILEWLPTERVATVEDCGRKASAEAVLTVEAGHFFPQELRYSLKSPSGERIVVREAGEMSPASGSYTVDLSAYDAEGTWTLIAEDTRWTVTGTLNSWSLTL